MDINSLLTVSNDSNSLVTIEATVCSGFEQEAFSECIDKFGKDLDIFKNRGRICFNINVEKYSLVKELRSVDNLSLILNHFKIAVSNDPANKESDLDVVKQLVDEIKWEKYITIWANILSYEGIIFPTRDQYLISTNKICAPDTNTDQNLTTTNINKTSDDCNKFEYIDKHITDIANHNAINEDRLDKNCLLEANKVLKYRVTCYRSGKHSFSSQEAAYRFGGLLQDRYNWIVDLSNYNLEIVLKITDDSAIILLSLTESSLHRRNITHFGLTTLRATLCYNMLRLAEISFGDIVMDPLCGSGSIPIEGSLSFPGTVHICGDISKKAVKLTRMNIESLRSKSKQLTVEPVKWNASLLPLKDESVDVVVTDLPFGKRVGSKANNRILYSDVLKELSRVVKSETGRAVFLTTNRNTFTSILSRHKEYWQQKKMLTINMGGLRGFVYLLLRTAKKIK